MLRDRKVSGIRAARYIKIASGIEDYARGRGLIVSATTQVCGEQLGASRWINLDEQNVISATEVFDPIHCAERAASGISQNVCVIASVERDRLRNGIVVRTEECRIEKRRGCSVELGYEGIVASETVNTRVANGGRSDRKGHPETERGSRNI